MRRPRSNGERTGGASVESGFRGPVEPLEDLDAKHIALFYESRAEQFAAMVPFVRQGLERGERVMYVIYEPTEEDVLEAMRRGGIDVDAATSSGALSFHTIEETYLRTGTFDPDDMLCVYRDALEEANADYPGFRVTADTIVNHHGGDIWADSEPGEGTTFYFTLPTERT